MPARKKKRTYRRKSFSVLNALEAYVYATILTEGVAGTSPIGLITGATDLGTKMTSVGMGSRPEQTLTVSGAGEISLGDILSEPQLALETMSSNFQNNLAPMAIAAFTTSMTFRIGKRLLRRPISNINRNIMKPALGAGIKL
tara:strand:+ start:2599 stop:3024 length:426 start_codon:yes stop_codon:yes gene_type:complete